MVLIIAEAGVNHNGSLIRAKELVDVAKDCGADIVKFQSFKSNNLVIKDTKKAEYQSINTNNEDSQLEMLSKLELTSEELLDLKNYCTSKNIEFLSTAFDLESLDLINKMNLKRFKIPSGEITNLPYLRKIGSFGKSIILSTGMANITEIGNALNELYLAGTLRKDVSILHCTSEYPAPFKDVNLRAMSTIKKEFNVKVGYSDHTLGVEVALAAVSLGAHIIEKHLTLDKNLSGPDHKASLEPQEFNNLVKGIRNITVALGKNEKKIANSEIKNLQIVRKSIVAKKDIKKGEFYTEENLTTKRPAIGICPMRWDEIIGKKSNKYYKIDDLIEF
ncbi:N-acetylneuraminate synthase [uncultured Prochlorococcus sp.]|uniref:N-acetylneuraminate synthase n=1 Tax=uncultured Prochlorococcus sp. TaxID=159733 RepID=UPI00258C0C66|nr:N-acetylneuraminate synthase [uncultured Prochlorococcus sp.]